MARRRNYRGRRVIFPLGVLLLATAGFALTAGLNRWLVFLGGVAYLGLIDDLAGGEPRGWRGHGRAVASGELSTGAIKAVGTVVLAAYAAAGEGATGGLLLAEVPVLALAAHLGNLLDTRPGRVEKALAATIVVVCVVSRSLGALAPIAPLLAAVAVGSWLTLSERAMWGDTGASAIGGMVGVLLVTSLSVTGIALSLALLVAISLYGEFRSISATIERVPLFERLDSVGRVN